MHPNEKALSTAYGNVWRMFKKASAI